jgi:hypothetical protein
MDAFTVTYSTAAVDAEIKLPVNDKVDWFQEHYPIQWCVIA